MNKTIASLALLKTNWDNATNPKDFLDIFVPFIVTLIKRKNYRSIDVNAVCKDFISEYGLIVPYHPMLAILTRTMKAGYIKKRSNWEYVPVRDKIVAGDFTESALRQERKYKYVLEQFLEYCQAKHGETLTKEEAESVFVAFLKDHDLDILFINQDYNTLLPNSSATISQRYLINSFVEHVNKSNPEIFAFVVDISVGHILANTFLYSDFDKYQGNLSTCCFYLDIGFLFNVMGINGDEKQTAYSDFVKLIVEQNASLFLFRHTYDEFLGILEGCLQWVESAYFDPSKASRAAKYFVENSFSVSDIEQFILKTSDNLSDLKIQLWDAPAPMKDTDHQIGEAQLTDIIVGLYKKDQPTFDETEKELTIYKDVKSISAIYKLRGGNKPTKLHEAGHIFITTNSSLAFASRLYELQSAKEKYFFIPAALTDVFVGTLIWLQSPSKVAEINKKRLIASCFAALEPTKPMIKKLTETADRLKLEGTITEEDVTLLKQSRVARNLLQEETLGDPNRFADKTVVEILGEIRADIQKEAEEKFDQERNAFKNQTTELLTEIEIQRQHTQTIGQQHSQTRTELEAVQSEKANIEGNIDKVADRIVSILTGVFYVFSIILAIAVSIFQFYPKLIGNRPILNLFLIVIAVLLSLAGLFAVFIKSVGNRMRLFLKKRIVQFLKGRK